MFKTCAIAAALALAMFAAGTPKVIAGQVDGVRLRRQINKLEERNARLEGRLQEMGVTLANQRWPSRLCSRMSGMKKRKSCDGT